MDCFDHLSLEFANYSISINIHAFFVTGEQISSLIISNNRKPMNEKEMRDFGRSMMAKLKTYQKTSYRKAAWQLINSIVPFVGIWIAMYHAFSIHLALFFGLGLINMFFLVRIFIIQHDCGHHSFVKSKQLRDVIGFTCSIFSAMPYKYWADSHAFHHNHNGQLEHRDIGDINTLTVKEYQAMGAWDRFKYRVFRFAPVTFLIGPMVYLIRNMRFPLVILGERKTKAYWSVMLNNAVVIGGVVLMSLLLDWKAALATYFTVMYLFSIVAIWFFFVQHQHENGYKRWEENWDHFVAALKGSTYYKLPRLFNWLTGNIGVHHIHHLYAAIPNYNLVRCIKENPEFNEHTTVVTFWESLKFMKHKLWDEDTQRMITFTEYKRMYPVAA
jgi:omega-6 fatty acid desaturase (delta-12 desaturase)